MPDDPPTTYPCVHDATSIVGIHALIRSTDDWNRALRAGTRPRMTATVNTTLAEALRADLAGVLCHGSLGHVRRQRLLARHLIQELGDERIADWTEPELREHSMAYIAAYEGVRPNDLLRREVCLLRRMVQTVQADVHGVCLVNARGPVERHRIGLAAARPVTSLRVVADVAARARNPLVRLAVLLVVAVGLRHGQLLALRRGDVDLPHERIRFDGVVRLLPSWAVDELRRLLGPEQGYLFPSRRCPGRPLTTMGRNLAKACDWAGHPAFTFQDLRRVWQREARAVCMPRACVRDTIGRLRGKALDDLLREIARADRRLCRVWTELPNGPADTAAHRRHVPARAPKEVQPDQPEWSPPARATAAAPLHRIAPSCHPDAWREVAADVPPRVAPSRARGRRRSTPGLDPSVWEHPPSSADAVPAFVAPPVASPAVSLPPGLIHELQRLVRTWGGCTPETFVTRQEALQAAAVVVPGSIVLSHHLLSEHGMSPEQRRRLAKLLSAMAADLEARERGG